ncbi:uncharacterized protein [Spinacia oleracea]|uniref:KIB1-4 beta-propeller domain-containing protein n=1 Tax=Spinacia oleracea TaxID=3562 RepID=A0ABM3RJY6_SPIOL|nr:uncharacterized protein LOC130470249 [Spinacia oleracea]XP_056695939.1 uncharacterized protein LOC130470251 [Spinacia oleracea]
MSPCLKGDLFWNQQEAEDVIFNPRKKGRMDDVNWAELQVDLLVKIVGNHLHSAVDMVAFSGVCPSWRNASNLANVKQKWACQMPWLMLTDGNLELTADYEDEPIDDDDDDETIESIQDDDETIDGKTNEDDDETNEDDDETIEDETIDDDTIEDEDEDEDDETIEDDNSKEASSSVDNNVRRRRTLVDLRHKDGRSYNVECCQGYGKSCWGSAHGWIVTHGLDDNMYLFNPLTKEQLNLPPRHTYEYGPYKRTCPPDFLRAYFITKAVLLKVPISGGLLVVALHSDGCGVVIAKPGDTHWTEISIPIQGLKMSRRITDVLYLANQGRILLLNQYGDLAYFDLEDVQKQVRWYDCELSYINQLRHPYGYDFVDHTTYIVNSGKDLLMVLRILDVVKNYADMVRDDDGHDIDQYKTVNFKVYKFHFQDKTWEELEDLLDVALFVGNNASMSVRATDAGCDHNCIYFTDDQRYYYAETKAGLGGHDIGVFRMSDKIIRSLDVGNNTHLRSPYCCPLWFSPAL